MKLKLAEDTTMQVVEEEINKVGGAECISTGVLEYGDGRIRSRANRRALHDLAGLSMDLCSMAR